MPLHMPREGSEFRGSESAVCWRRSAGARLDMRMSQSRILTVSRTRTRYARQSKVLASVSIYRTACLHHLHESILCRTELKTLVDTCINIKVSPFQMVGVIRVSGANARSFYHPDLLPPQMCEKQPTLSVPVCVHDETWVPPKAAQDLTATRESIGGPRKRRAAIVFPAPPYSHPCRLVSVMFCPQCKAEYRPGFTHCSDCD